MLFPDTLSSEGHEQDKLEIYKKYWISSFTIIHFIRDCGRFINAGQQTAPAAASAFQGYFMSVLEHLAYIS